MTGERAIRLLADTRRYNPMTNPTPSEILVRRVERMGLVGACASVAVVMLAVCVFWLFGWTITMSLRGAGMLILYAGVGCAVVFLSADPVSYILRIGKMMDDPWHHSIGSYRHEQTIVRELSLFSAAVLASVDHWLVTRVTGIESRVGVVFGEKVSVLALLASLIAVGKALLDMHNAGPNLAFGWGWVLVAIVVGMVLVGGVALRVVSTSYAYQRQLLGEAIRVRGEQDARDAGLAS